MIVDGNLAGRIQEIISSCGNNVSYISQNSFQNLSSNNATCDPINTNSGTVPVACNSPDESMPVVDASGQSPLSLLKKIRLKNVGRLIIASLNINSIANKFDRLEEIVKENVDILIILETKIDNILFHPLNLG